MHITHSSRVRSIALSLAIASVSAPVTGCDAPEAFGASIDPAHGDVDHETLVVEGPAADVLLQTFRIARERQGWRTFARPAVLDLGPYLISTITMDEFVVQCVERGAWSEPEPWRRSYEAWGATRCAIEGAIFDIRDGRVTLTGPAATALGSVLGHVANVAIEGVAQIDAVPAYDASLRRYGANEAGIFYGDDGCDERSCLLYCSSLGDGPNDEAVCTIAHEPPDPALEPPSIDDHYDAPVRVVTINGGLFRSNPAMEARDPRNDGDPLPFFTPFFPPSHLRVRDSEADPIASLLFDALTARPAATTAIVADGEATLDVAGLGAVLCGRLAQGNQVTTRCYVSLDDTSTDERAGHVELMAGGPACTALEAALAPNPGIDSIDVPAGHPLARFISKMESAAEGPTHDPRWPAPTGFSSSTAERFVFWDECHSDLSLEPDERGDPRCARLGDQQSVQRACLIITNAAQFAAYDPLRALDNQALADFTNDWE